MLFRPFSSQLFMVLFSIPKILDSVFLVIISEFCLSPPLSKQVPKSVCPSSSTKVSLSRLTPAMAATSVA